jgi:hypothetical protein
VNRAADRLNSSLGVIICIVSILCSLQTGLLKVPGCTNLVRDHASTRTADIKSEHVMRGVPIVRRRAYAPAMSDPSRGHHVEARWAISSGRHSRVHLLAFQQGFQVLVPFREIPFYRARQHRLGNLEQACRLSLEAHMYLGAAIGWLEPIADLMG